ncbi:MAG: transcription termination factor Rho [Lachnospiraceae bacterium]|nr:transcription termination factor Rho [Lachnospiraceae bacterium]
MREKLKTLPLAELRAIAKQLTVPQYYSLRKPELIEILVSIHEKQNEPSAPSAPEKAEEGTPKRPGRGRKSAKVQDEPKKDAESQQAEAEIRETAPKEQESEYAMPKAIQDLDTGRKQAGILEIIYENNSDKMFGFLRANGFTNSEDDLYVAASQIKRFNLKTGDYIVGSVRQRNENERPALLFIDTINGLPVSQHDKLVSFENLTPVFPHERLHLEIPNGEISMRIVDLLSPIGKGQRGLIVAQPKVGKTTLLKQIAKSMLRNHPELHVIILLIDERPEEVTDMKDTFQSDHVEIVYSTFDEPQEHHKHMAEFVIERAKRMVEYKKDVVILLDSITRLTRAYNLTCTPSGRTLSGGLDPAALYPPKHFFGAARCMKEGGSLTILATALTETGSRLDDVVYEEFKGTGNMELVLNRKLSERRIFPAIDILKSSTRRDDLLLSQAEQDAVKLIHRVTTQGTRPEAATEMVLDLFSNTRSNAEFMAKIKTIQFY